MYRISIQMLSFLAILPTGQKGIGNRDKAYLYSQKLI